MDSRNCQTATATPAEPGDLLSLYPLTFKQRFHSLFDLISDGPDFLNGLPFWIEERPIVTAEPRYIRTFIAAAHGDEKLRVPRQVVCQLLRLGVAEVNSNLLHGRKNLWLNTQFWVSSRRYGYSFLWISKLIEKCGRHLRTACIMNTGKNHFNHGFPSCLLLTERLPQDDFSS